MLWEQYFNKAVKSLREKGVKLGRKGEGMRKKEKREKKKKDNCVFFTKS